MVPVRGGLLVQTSGNTLTLMREVQPPAGPPAVMQADRWAAAVPEGAIALGDGNVLKGPLVREAAAGTVEGTNDAKRRSRHKVADVLAVVDGKGALLLAPDAEGAVRGVALVGEAREAAAYATLARDAIAAKDLARGERALREALARGASDAVVAPLEKGLEELRKYTANATVKPLRQDVLTEAENAILKSRAHAFWTASASLPSDAPWLLRSRLARAALEADPAHAQSVEFVRSAVPAVFRLGPTFDALEWLSLADAVQHAPVTPVEESSPAARRARVDWKPDLLALQSRQLLVLTDVRDPARIGVCLSMGELVCRTLERLLGDAAGGRMDPDRLTLHLFETKEGYLASSPGKGETGRGMENTAGHYDPGANLSRIYVPEGPEAFEEVAGTYAHELTHHWVFQRCPLFKDAELARKPSLTPGFWIVEGLADFLAEGLYDVGRHEAELFNVRSLSLDMVANAPSGGLIPWPRFFGLNQAFFHRLDTTKPIVIPTRWRLGWLQSPTEISMFYAQGAAVCHYLYGVDGGKHRAKTCRRWCATTTRAERATNTSNRSSGRRRTHWARPSSSTRARCRPGRCRNPPRWASDPSTRAAERRLGRMRFPVLLACLLAAGAARAEDGPSAVPPPAAGTPRGHGDRARRPPALGLRGGADARARRAQRGAGLRRALRDELRVGDRRAAATGPRHDRILRRGDRAAG